MSKLLPCLFLFSFLLSGCQGKKNTSEKNSFSGEAAGIPVFNEKEILENLYRLLSDSAAKSLPDSVLADYYKKERHPLLWAEHPRENPRVNTLLEELEKASSHGLPPEIFGLAHLKNLSEQTYRPHSTKETARLLARLEYDMSRAYLTYAAGMQFGFIRPASILNQLETEENPVTGLPLKQADGTVRKKALYSIPLRTPDRIFFREALSEAALDLSSFMKKIQPSGSLYFSLQTAYRQLDELEDTAFTPLPLIGDTLLKAGSRHRIFPLIARRLLLTGEIPFTAYPDSLYATLTPRLLEAVNRFRETNGLSDDTQIGNRTIRLLNRPVRYYRNSLRANMERLRWKPLAPKSQRYIIVNVAASLLRATDLPADTVLEMKVCVGSPRNKTPLLASQIQYMELNPYWNVPQSIVRKEIFPSYRRDSSYFTRNRMKIYDRDGNEIAPDDFLEAASKGTFPYQVRQENKGGNSLGRIIFRFPNTFSVYLHDTPSKQAFGRDNRAISHGCVRVEHPLDLAFFLLGEKENVLADRIRHAAGLPARTPEGKETVNKANYKELKYHYLKKTVPVFLDYYTVYPSENGKLIYHEDIYGYDNLLLKALDKINRQQP